MGNKASAAVFDALSNITTVKILHIENSVLKGVMARYRAPRLLYRSNAILNESKWFTGMMLFQFVALVPFGFYLFTLMGQQNSADVQTVSTLFLYLMELMLVFYRFGSVYEQITVQKNRVGNAEWIEQAISAHEQIKKPEKAWQHLHIRNLFFKYQDQVIPSLDNLSFRLKARRACAIIGESGSGKTTFLKVLHGMYPKASAFISLDDAHF